MAKSQNEARQISNAQRIAYDAENGGAVTDRGGNYIGNVDRIANIGQLTQGGARIVSKPKEYYTYVERPALDARQRLIQNGEVSATSNSANVTSSTIPPKSNGILNFVNTEAFKVKGWLLEKGDITEEKIAEKRASLAPKSFSNLYNIPAHVELGIASLGMFGLRVAGNVDELPKAIYTTFRHPSTIVEANVAIGKNIIDSVVSDPVGGGVELGTAILLGGAFSKSGKSIKGSAESGLKTGVKNAAEAEVSIKNLQNVKTPTVAMEEGTFKTGVIDEYAVSNLKSTGTLDIGKQSFKLKTDTVTKKAGENINVQQKIQLEKQPANIVDSLKQSVFGKDKPVELHIESQGQLLSGEPLNGLNLQSAQLEGSIYNLNPKPPKVSAYQKVRSRIAPQNNPKAGTAIAEPAPLNPLESFNADILSVSKRTANEVINGNFAKNTKNVQVSAGKESGIAFTRLTRLGAKSLKAEQEYLKSIYNLEFMSKNVKGAATNDILTSEPTAFLESGKMSATEVSQSNPFTLSDLEAAMTRDSSIGSSGRTSRIGGSTQRAEYIRMSANADNPASVFSDDIGINILKGTSNLKKTNAGANAATTKATQNAGINRAADILNRQQMEASRASTARIHAAGNALRTGLMSIGTQNSLNFAQRRIQADRNRIAQVKQNMGVQNNARTVLTLRNNLLRLSQNVPVRSGRTTIEKANNQAIEKSGNKAVTTRGTANLMNTPIMDLTIGSPTDLLNIKNEIIPKKETPIAKKGKDELVKKPKDEIIKQEPPFKNPNNPFFKPPTIIPRDPFFEPPVIPKKGRGGFPFGGQGASIGFGFVGRTRSRNKTSKHQMARARDLLNLVVSSNNFTPITSSKKHVQRSTKKGGASQNHFKRHR